jgi:glycosyltransferase involved in cell wall biosynthesis
MGVVKPGVATRMAERLELSIYRSAAGVTGQSQEIIDSVRRRAPGVPTAVITNGVDPDRFAPSRSDADARARLGDEPGPIFLYAGLLGWAQGLDQLLDVAAALPIDVPGRFVLVGEGADRARLMARLAREPNQRVRIVAAQARERIPAILASADVAAITLGMTLPGAVPSKIYEAMAAALPILLIAEGEAARRVTDAGCGIAVRPGDRASAVTAFVTLATDAELRRRLGEAGRRAAETTYHRHAIARTLDGFLRGRLAPQLAPQPAAFADIQR